MAPVIVEPASIDFMRPPQRLKDTRGHYRAVAANASEWLVDRLADARGYTFSETAEARRALLIGMRLRQNCVGGAWAHADSRGATGASTTMRLEPHLSPDTS